MMHCSRISRLAAGGLLIVAIGCGSGDDVQFPDSTTSSSSSGGGGAGATSSTGSASTGGGGAGGGSAPAGNFSFFVTSLRAMQELSGSQDGFGGDLRFGEMGPGAGLRGADKICATIAEKSSAGSLSADERAEYGRIVRLNDLLSAIRLQVEDLWAHRAAS